VMDNTNLTMDEQFDFLLSHSRKAMIEI
jgi:hypothetical protein